MSSSLTAADLRQLSASGISAEEAERQLALLVSPPAPAALARPCTVGDGIVKIDDPGHLDELEARGRAAAAAGRLAKFVPASGAASRMFRMLAAVREKGLAGSSRQLAAAASAGDGDAADALRFTEVLPRLALAGPLAERLGVDPAELARRAATGPLEPLLDALLDADGLDAARLPKALLPFHLENARPVTAFEEQIAEGALYVVDGEGLARIHFTISPGVRERFTAELEALAPRIAAAGATAEVRFSEQSSATDTLALDAAGRPARTADGRLLLRPSGHGALLANLAATGGDLVVIKNIDNVLPRRHHPEVARLKRILAGLADALREESSGADQERPLRICGVVANSGEPGGGPFWVARRDGTVAPQIVESSQVALGRADQLAAWRAATHFNPVDLVVALRDGAGRPFQLERFVDPTAAIVTTKSEGGRTLTVLERPGLWNGAMAGWRTVFVEVPSWTFAPVKSVLDLARPEHQGD